MRFGYWNGPDLASEAVGCYAPFAPATGARAAGSLDHQTTEKISLRMDFVSRFHYAAARAYIFVELPLAVTFSEGLLLTGDAQTGTVDDPRDIPRSFLITLWWPL